MHRNGIFYALICINNHVLSCLINMLSLGMHNVNFYFRMQLLDSLGDVVSYEELVHEKNQSFSMGPLMEIM